MLRLGEETDGNTGGGLRKQKDWRLWGWEERIRWWYKKEGCEGEAEENGGKLKEK